MERISFQGRNLATAHRIWQKMLQDDVTIFLGWPARCRPAACGWWSSHLILQPLRRLPRLDRREPLSRSPRNARPASLRRLAARRRCRAGRRIASTASTTRYASEEEFCSNDEWIADFATHARDAQLHHARIPAPARRPPLEDHRARRHPDQRPTAPTCRSSARRSPIRRSAWGSSQARQKKAGAGYIDIIGDIVESANLVIRRPRTASVVLGGGTPKNFINQASVQAEFYSDEVGGHRYALQIVTDVPHFGGASGSSLEEAQSWGKLADRFRQGVRCSATRPSPCRCWRARWRRPRRRCSPRRKPDVHPGRPRHDGRRPDRAPRTLRGSECACRLSTISSPSGSTAARRRPPPTFEHARVVILPIPLDRTTSYVPGTRNGPHEILGRLVAHGVVGRGDADRRAQHRHLHAAGDGVPVRVDGRGGARDPRASRPRCVNRDKFPSHPRRRALDHAGGGGRGRGEVSRRVGPADRRARRPARRRSWGRRTTTPARCGARSSSRRRRRSASAACRPRRPRPPRRWRPTIFYDFNMRENADWIDRVVDSLSEHVYITIDVDGLDPAIMPADRHAGARRAVVV